MEKQIRKLIYLFGSPFVENFDDYSEDANKETACEMILNNIEWEHPFEKISRVLISELTKYILWNVPKGKYDIDTIEKSMTHMVLLCSFPEYNMKANRQELMRLIDWENVFDELGESVFE